MRQRADVVFLRLKVAVFVDGCFWHQCPIHGTSPKQNGSWWAAKLAANSERDRRSRRRLKEAGWTVVQVWEHEAPAQAAIRIKQAISSHD
jgi:DNA mismatch endonuclease (patch repair protein)